MSEFGIVNQANSKQATVKRESDFIKLTNDHQTVVRVLDKQPVVSWSHWVPKNHHQFPTTNKGKGMSFVCPGIDICPICAWNKSQKEADPTTTDLLKARKIFTFNVLDRTATVICPKCAMEHYANPKYPTKCTCGTDISKVNPAPRNKVLIMQKGKRIIDQLENLENDPEFGDLGAYDIKCDTRGVGTDSMTACLPKQKVALDYPTILGKPVEEVKHNIAETMKPLAPEQISRILSGEDYYTVAGKTS